MNIFWFLCRKLNIFGFWTIGQTKQDVLKESLWVLGTCNETYFTLSCFTWAVEWLGQLSGHDLDDETNTESEHLAEQAGLSPDVHSQVHHDLLEEGDGLKMKKMGWIPWRELITWLTWVSMATLMLLSLASSMRTASWSGGIGAVMVFSLGSEGRPTVRCFWCASKSEQAYEQITANQKKSTGKV